jgi:hypothetical protein
MGPRDGVLAVSLLIEVTLEEVSMNRLGTCSIVSLLVASALVAGCAVPTASDAGSSIAVHETGALPLPGAVEVRIDRRAGESAFEVVNAPGLRAIQPGVWEYVVGENKQQIVVGEAGHQWLADETARQIDALRAQVEGGDSAESLVQQIAQLEQVNDQVQTAAARERESAAVTPAAVSCNISRYTGPSGPVFGVVGATALSEIVCSGGTESFTTTSQACCAGVCTPVNAVTDVVGATAMLAGSLFEGTGAGAAMVTVTPPGAMQSTTLFTCD